MSRAFAQHVDGLCDVVAPNSKEKPGRRSERMSGLLRHSVMAGLRERIILLQDKAGLSWNTRQHAVNV